MIIDKTETELFQLYTKGLLEMAKIRLIKQGFADPSLSHAVSYVSNLKNSKETVEWIRFEHEAGCLMSSRVDAENKKNNVERS